MHAAIRLLSMTGARTRGVTRSPGGAGSVHRVNRGVRRSRRPWPSIYTTHGPGGLFATFIENLFFWSRPARRCRERGRRRSRRVATEARHMLHAPQVDARQQHSQFAGLELDAAAAVLHHGNAERAGFQSLVPHGIAIVIPIQNLDPIAGATDEQKEMSTERIVSE